MPIDFNDLLDSLRSDGKLVVASLVKAVTGKHVIQDIRDGATSVEFDVEDENETASTVTIPKGATTFAQLSGQIADNQIPAFIMRDAEFTAAAVRALLGLSATEVNDLFVGATIMGQTLTFTQNDGSVVQIAIPTAQAGTGDGVVQSGAISGTNLVLTLDTGGMVTIDIDALATDTELATRAPVNNPSLTGTPRTVTPVGSASGTEITNAAWVLARLMGYATSGALTALAARVTALENATPPTPHSETRYAALRLTGATPGDFTVADFQGAGATSSTTQDIYTPASDTDMVVGIAVPVAEGPLTAVAEIDADGNVNQFANAIRGNFLPAVGDTQITLTIDGQAHYIYATQGIVRGLLLGSIGYRLTQTAP